MIIHPQNSEGLPNLAGSNSATYKHLTPGLVFERKAPYMRTLLLAFLTSALLPLTACHLYFSGGDDDDDVHPCEDWGGGFSDGLAEPAQLRRNPETGACEAFGSDDRPPYPCDGTCGPCYDTADSTPTEPDPTPPPTQNPDGTAPDPSGAEQDGAERAPTPAWGFCDSYCTGLDEFSCLATDGCRGIYSSFPIDSPGEFQECWQTGSAPVRVDDCEGLDAYTCSQSDQCVAVHAFYCDGNELQAPSGLSVPACQAGPFVACGNEGAEADGCYGDNDCALGTHCNAADICLPPPGGGACPDDQCDAPTSALCYGYCVPDTDPGECDGVLWCDGLAPTCPQGTTPGIANGCWTGHCIALSSCPMAECVDIQGEAMCIAREDCNPYYFGEDCQCDPQGCECTSWIFDSCHSSGP